MKPSKATRRAEGRDQPGGSRASRPAVPAVLSGNGRMELRVPFLASPNQLASAEHRRIDGGSRQPIKAFREL
jgi:hypothetical protein